MSSSIIWIPGIRIIRLGGRHPLPVESCCWYLPCFYRQNIEDITRWCHQLVKKTDFHPSTCPIYIFTFLSHHTRFNVFPLLQPLLFLLLLSSLTFLLPAIHAGGCELRSFPLTLSAQGISSPLGEAVPQRPTWLARKQILSDPPATLYRILEMDPPGLADLWSGTTLADGLTTAWETSGQGSLPSHA